jgi:predicted RNA binding protein YcfA (HicA-like mRNA interferase family)
MGKCPKPTGKRLIRALKKNGYKQIRERGSHVIMQNERDKRIIFTVPNYTETLSYDLLDRIRKYNLKISKEKFEKILKDC